jgi:putative nucleotidyltransferase with HDIG domain
MKFEKEIYQKIWELALPYQDKRDDAGHAEVVTKFAIRLCKLEKANGDIVIPAAILHDIGWSRLSDEERFIIFNPDATKEDKFKIRLRHQEEGVKLAVEILNKVNYSPKFADQILEIISQHDTRRGFLSLEDGIMRDADKLWRFSQIGFDADIRRRETTFAEWYNHLRKRIEEKDFFFSRAAKQLAGNELENRKKEFEMKQ